jgi:alpha-glucoside transport system permease protein
MATATEVQESSGFLQSLLTTIGRVLVSLFVPVVTFVVLWQGAIFLRDTDAPQWVAAVIAVVWGVGGVAALFFVANFVIDRLPDAWKRRLTPFVFVGPALAILAWYLLLPTVRSFYTSLFNANSTEFVGLDWSGYSWGPV